MIIIQRQLRFQELQDQKYLDLNPGPAAFLLYVTLGKPFNLPQF